MSLNRRDFIQNGTLLGSGIAAGVLPVDAVEAAAGGTPVAPPSFSDPLLNKPYVDVDEWRDRPSRHRYVHGGFTGSDAKFLILFPPREQYQGRFFQHNTAIPVSELVAGNIFGGDFAGFCFDSGAAAVVTNQGGFNNIPQYDSALRDPSIGSYRVAAATAMYTRALAQQMYGAHRCYGYAFGGSGGGYRTFACAENTDAWEGVVPYIHGNAQAWPNSYAGRARGQRTLKHKVAAIADALEPGGGDVNAVLTSEERGIFDEINGLGFPKRTWIFADTMGVGPLSVLFQSIQGLDPGYFEDFWTKPGYLGFDSPHSFEGVRVQHRSVVTRIIMSNEAAAAGLPAPGGVGRGNQADPDTAWRNFQADYGAPLPVALQLQSMPTAGSFLDMANIKVMTGGSTGKWLVLGGINGNFAKLQFSPAGGSLRDITDAIRVGDEVQIDNSNILAYETYYRHALLTPDFYPGNQFRRADGTPKYPQRPKLIAFDLMKGATPTLPTGKFHGKMIVIQNLVDWDAHAWYADWYRTKVRDHLGRQFGDRYRLYYTDHATHGPIPDPTRVINYSGVLQQALRDLSAWVERGVAPPQETSYQVKESQVLVPPAARQRKGIQPVVTLLANGEVRANVKVGEVVKFTAVAEAPARAGSVVSAEWDFDATAALKAGDVNRFQISEHIAPAPRVALARQYSFAKPGTYFPALRVHSQRQGNAGTPYARVPNLGRVRVVVT